MGSSNTGESNYLNSHKVDYYSILGISKHATAQEIRKKYKLLCLSAHPDHGGSTEKMSLLNEAHRVLLSEEERAQHDESLDDDDDSICNDLFRLGDGTRMSDGWKSEFDKYRSCFLSSSVSDKRFMDLKHLKEMFEKVDCDYSLFHCNFCGPLSHACNLSHDFEKLFDNADSLEQHLLKESGSPLNLNQDSEHRLCQTLCDHIERNIKQCKKVIQIVSQMPLYIEEPSIFHKIREAMSCMKPIRLERELRRYPLSDNDFFKNHRSKLVLPMFPGYQDLSKFPSYSIETIPSQTISSPSGVCECGNSFGIFCWKHPCALCKKDNCSNCVINSLVPHYGLVDQAVSICKACIQSMYQKDLKVLLKWVTTTRDSTPNLDIDSPMYYLFQLLNHFGSLSQWKEVIEALFTMGCYKEAMRGVATMISSKRFSNSETIKGFRETNNTLWLVISKKIQDSETFLKTVTENVEKQQSNLFGVYLMATVSKTKQFFTPNNAKALLFYLQLKKYSSSQILNIAEWYVSRENYPISYMLVRYALKIDRNLKFSSNSILDSFLQIQQEGGEEKIEQLIQCHLKNPKATCFLLALAHWRGQDKSFWWKKVISLRDRNRYFESLVFWKAWNTIVYDTPSIIDVAHQFNSLSWKILAFRMGCADWSIVGQNCLDSGDFDGALGCFLQLPSSQCETLISSSVDKLPSVQQKKKWMFHLLKKDKRAFLGKVASTIAKQDSNIYLHAAKTAKNLKLTYTGYVKLFLNQIVEKDSPNQSSAKLLLSGVHFIGIANPQNVKIAQYAYGKYENFRQKLYNAASHCNFLEVVHLLKNIGNRLALLDVEAVNFWIMGSQGVDQLPSQYQALVLIGRAYQAKWNGNFIDCVNHLQDAMHACPDSRPAVVESICDETIRKGLLIDLHECLRNMSFSSWTPSILMSHHADLLKSSTMTRIVKNFEKGILRDGVTWLEKAWLYCDMCMAVGYPITFNNLLLACYCLLQHMRTTLKADEKYACFKLIELLITVITIRRHGDPAQKLYFLLIGLAILVQALEEPIIPPGHASKQKKTSKLIISSVLAPHFPCSLISQQAEMCPLIPTLRRSFDHLSSCVHNWIFMKEFYSALLTSEDTLIPPYLAQYMLFQGEVCGWMDECPGTRSKAIEMMLSTKGWCVEQVQEILQWPMIPRCDEGYYKSQYQSLNLSEPAYASLDGFSLDYETGTVDFELTRSECCLFNLKDIYETVQFDIDNPLFTLDQPSPSQKFEYHPFQEMKYHPKSLHKSKNFLNTLLHTDYLLKMLTTGMEVSAVAPFDLRPASEGLLSRLPPELREIIEEYHQEKTGEDKAHRFWIEVDNVEWNIDTTDNGVKVSFYNFDMRVNTHPMTCDQNGNFVDTEHGADKDSAESIFAHKFSEYYDEFASFFPELSRLKELAKFGLMNRILRHHCINFEEELEQIDKQISNVLKFLRESAPRKFPRSVDDILAKNGYSRNQVSYSSISELSSQLKKQENDLVEHIYSQLEKIGIKGDDGGVMSSFLGYITGTSLRSLISSYLRSKNISVLENYIRDSLYKKYAYPGKKRIIMLCKERFKIEKWIHECQPELSNVGCSWVPAAYGSTGTSHIYGGVNLGISGKKLVSRDNSFFNGNTYQGKNEVRIPTTYKPRGGDRISFDVRVHVPSNIPNTSINRDRMRKGLNPLDKNGKVMEWHHLNQADTYSQNGKITLVTAAVHDKHPHKLQSESTINRNHFRSQLRQVNRHICQMLFQNQDRVIETLK